MDFIKKIPIFLSSRGERSQNFFIAGSVWSETTLLKDILRRQPMLACTMENDLYRCAYPFGSRGFEDSYRESRYLQGHPQREKAAHQHYMGIYKGFRVASGVF